MVAIVYVTDAVSRASARTHGRLADRTLKFRRASTGKIDARAPVETSVRAAYAVADILPAYGRISPRNANLTLAVANRTANGLVACASGERRITDALWNVARIVDVVPTAARHGATTDTTLRIDRAHRCGAVRTSKPWVAQTEARCCARAAARANALHRNVAIRSRKPVRAALRIE
jgi:hypothetical protein